MKNIGKRFLGVFLSAIMMVGLLAVTSIITAAAGSDGDFYVSPTGSDSANGTISAPFKTLEKARDEVRKVNASMNKDIIVYIRGGVYTQTKTLDFNNSDSGNNGHKVIYKAYPGENPVISGGREITGFTVYDASKNIYKATVPNGFRFRQLYVNDQKAIRSRYPNRDADQIAGMDPILSVTNPQYTEVANGGKLEVGVSPEAITSTGGTWANISDTNNYPEFMIHQGFVVSTMRIKTAKVETKGVPKDGRYLPGAKLSDGTTNVLETKTQAFITFQDEEAAPSQGYASFPPFRLGNNHFYWLENAYEFIDDDNEWFLDTKTNTLYYKAPEGVDLNNQKVSAPAIETIMSVKGSAPLDRAKNISFEGLTFRESTYMRPSDHGFLDHQSTQYIEPKKILSVCDKWRRSYGTNTDGTPVVKMTEGARAISHPPSAVIIENSDSVSFTNNTFTHTAITALEDYDGNRNTSITDNSFIEVGGIGVSVGVFWIEEMQQGKTYNPDPATGVGVIGTDIKNNYFTRCGSEFMGGTAISTGYPANIEINNNEIYDMPYSGLTQGYGWTSQKNFMNENDIKYNSIHMYGQTMSDGAAIYTLSEQRQTEQDRNGVIGYNLIDNSYRPWLPKAGIFSFYLDEQSNGFTVIGNSMFKTNTSITYNGTAPTNHPSYKPNNYQNGRVNYNEVINTSGETELFNTKEKDKDGNDIYVPIVKAAENERDATVYGAGFQAGHIKMNVPNFVLPVDAKVTAGSDIKVRPIGMTGYSLWLAPMGTTNFVEGNTITKLNNTFTADMNPDNTTFVPSVIKAPTATGTYKLYIMDDKGNVSKASYASVTVTPGTGNTAPVHSGVVVADGDGKFALKAQDSLSTLPLLADATPRVVASSGYTGGYASWKVNFAAPAAYNVSLKYRSHASVQGKVQIIDKNGTVVKFADFRNVKGSDRYTVGGDALLMMNSVPAGEYEVRITDITTDSQQTVDIAEVYLEETTPNFAAITDPLLAADASLIKGAAIPTLNSNASNPFPYITNMNAGAGVGAGAGWFVDLTHPASYTVTLDVDRPNPTAPNIETVGTALAVKVYNLQGVLQAPKINEYRVQNTRTNNNADGTFSNLVFRTDTLGTLDLSSLPAGNYKIEVTRTESANGRVNIKGMQLTPNVTSISATTTKNNYFVGQEIDKSTITASALFSGKSSATPLLQKDFSCEYDFSTAGTKTVTVKYAGKTTTFSVTVAEKNVDSIEITNPPINNNYNVGDTPDLEEIKVLVTYNDGTTEEIDSSNSDLIITDYDFSKPSQSSLVTISYKGATTTFTVAVNGDGPTYRQGDLNCDGFITSSDLVAIRKIILGITPFSSLSDVEKGLCNVDGLGGQEPTSTDLVAVRKIILGLAS